MSEALTIGALLAIAEGDVHYTELFLERLGKAKDMGLAEQEWPLIIH